MTDARFTPKRKDITMIGTVDSILACESGTTAFGVFRTTDPGPRAEKARGQAAPNPLERLVQIVRSNDRLTADLEASRARIVRARGALETVSGPNRLATMYLEHCKTKHRGILAQLRANRIEAHQILGENGSVS